MVLKESESFLSVMAPFLIFGGFILFFVVIVVLAIKYALDYATMDIHELHSHLFTRITTIKNLSMQIKHSLSRVCLMRGVQEKREALHQLKRLADDLEYNKNIILIMLPRLERESDYYRDAMATVKDVEEQLANLMNVLLLAGISIDFYEQYFK